MTDFWKKHKYHICLVLLIAGTACIPLGLDACVIDAKHRLSAAFVNLLTAGIASFCYGRMFESRNIGLAGSLLYTWCPYRCSDLYIQGDLRGGVAWSVVPIVILGLVQLYRSFGGAWVTLTVGFCLLAAFSPALFLIAVGSAVVTFVVMGKKSLCKPILICVGKTVVATAVISVVLLFPFLLQMRDTSLVGARIPENFRMMGMYLIQYLSIFPTEGSGLGVAQTGAVGIQSMGVGAAAVALVFLYLWSLFVHKIPRDDSRRVLCIVGILMLLSSNRFPWDLLQNKNMLFSIVLAWMQSPAKWGVAACGGLIWIACYMLQRLSAQGIFREFDGWKVNLEKENLSNTDVLQTGSLQTEGHKADSFEPDASKADSPETGSGKKSLNKLVLFWLPVLALLASLPMLVDYVIVGEELFEHLDKMSAFLNVFETNGSLLYRLFVIGINIITAVIAYISFSKGLQSGEEGLLGAVIYVLLPARILLLYRAANVEACVIMAFLPLAVWVLCRICRGAMKGKERLVVVPFVLVIAFVTGYGCIGYSSIRQDVVSIAATLLICVLFGMGSYWRNAAQGAKGRAALLSAGVIALTYGTWLLNDILMNGWEIFR